MAQGILVPEFCPLHLLLPFLAGVAAKKEKDDVGVCYTMCACGCRPRRVPAGRSSLSKLDQSRKRHTSSLSLERERSARKRRQVRQLDSNLTLSILFLFFFFLFSLAPPTFTTLRGHHLQFFQPLTSPDRYAMRKNHSFRSSAFPRSPPFMANQSESMHNRPRSRANFAFNIGVIMTLSRPN